MEGAMTRRAAKEGGNGEHGWAEERDKGINGGCAVCADETLLSTMDLVAYLGTRRCDQ